MAMMMQKKASLGRRKIPTDERIAKKNHRQVTFSKRKAGLMKKASELCTLCGVDVAVIVFSPAGKPFSFDADSVIHSFPGSRPKDHQTTAATSLMMEAHRKAAVERELILHLTELGDQVEAERKRGKALDQMLEATMRGSFWGTGPVSTMEVDQLQQMKLALQNLKSNINGGNYLSDHQVVVPPENNQLFYIPAPPVDHQSDHDYSWGGYGYDHFWF